jgi:hypothetical protein
MPRYRTLGYVDYDGQHSVVRLNMPNTYLPLVEDVAWVLLKDAIANVTRGTLVNEINATSTQHASSATRASDPEANRQSKWLITYEDTMQWIEQDVYPNPNYLKLFQTELPCANLVLRSNNSDVVYVPNGAGNEPLFEALVTQFELVVRSPSGGSVRVLQIKDVGRSI